MKAERLRIVYVSQMPQARRASAPGRGCRSDDRAGTLSCALGWPTLLTWSALALLAWNVFKARRDIYAVSMAARRIDRPFFPRGNASY
jgi:hypothetical protein